MDVKRYTQPVVQQQPGIDFKVAEVPLFEDAKGKYVLASDYDALAQQLAQASKERDALNKELADWQRMRNESMGLAHKQFASLSETQAELTACREANEAMRAAVQLAYDGFRIHLPKATRYIDALNAALKPSDAKEKT